MTEELSNPTTTTEMNSPEARSSSGELINQAAAQTASSNPAEAAGATTENGTSKNAPEAYDFKAPEGVTLDPDTIAEASPIFKELGLSQEQAQKLVDFYAARGAKTNESLAKAVEDMRAGWRDEVMKDKDIGPKLESVKTELGRAKDRMPAAVRTAFDEALNLTGLGDHPAIIKGFYEMAKLVNEGTHVRGGGPSEEGQNAPGKSSRPSIAGALYPNLSQ
jgi:hypothetical protein